MRSTALSARRAKQSIARKSWSRSSKTQNDSQRPLSRLGCARGSKRRQRLRASLEAAESYRTAFEAKTAVPGQLPPPSVMIGTIPRGARMSDRRRPRNLASSFTATGPRQWKVVGGDRVETCTFCGGGPTEAVVGSPDDDAPLPWQVAVCGPCLADTVMTRFAAVKHQHRGASQRHERGRGRDRQASRSCPMEQPDSAELRAEELEIREKFGLLEDTPLHNVTRRGSPLL
jgi:hypothetical protein